MALGIVEIRMLKVGSSEDCEGKLFMALPAELSQGIVEHNYCAIQVPFGCVSSCHVVE